MPRVARTVMPGFPHHVTQRGNNGQEVFLTDDDRRIYLRFLGYLASRCELRVVGYCLMANHIHIIGIPSTRQSLAKAVGRTHLLYTQYFNRQHKRSGHLWQNRFFSCPMDESHTWTALCYVEQNPVRAGLVKNAWQYPWSSAATHCGGPMGDSQWLDLDAWSKMWTPEQWREVLQCSAEPAQTEQVRRSTRTGRLLASDGLLRELESSFGRALQRPTRGRPKGIHTRWRRENK